MELEVGRGVVKNGGGIFIVLSRANMGILGGCHQGKAQQLHVRMTVLWSPVGNTQVSRAPDFTFY